MADAEGGERDREVLRVEVLDGIATLTLNRPDDLNALSPTVYDELCAATADVASDGQTRALVFKGNGRAFCAGDANSFTGTCALPGVCDTTSGLCAPHALGKATAARSPAAALLFGATQFLAWAKTEWAELADYGLNDRLRFLWHWGHARKLDRLI